MTECRLLVVDDDRFNRDLVSKLLKTSGYTVDSADDGARAVAMAHTRPYNLAVLDYQMPGMNGVEVYQELQQIRPGIVGVFLTSFTTLDTVYPAICAGIERVLAKPVDKHELLTLVEQLIGKPGDRSSVSDRN